MNIDFQEILKELEFRVPKGIIDLNQEEHVTTLVDILRENGVDDANGYAQRARVVFGYVNEASTKIQKVLNTTFVNPETGNNVKVGSALGYDKQSRAYRIAKDMFTNAGFSEKDIDMVDTDAGDEETPVKGKTKKQEPEKLGGAGLKSTAETGKTSKDIQSGKKVEVPISKNETTVPKSEGIHEMDKRKFTKAKNGDTTAPGINQETALENIKELFGDKVKVHEYNWNEKIKKQIQNVMHPAAFEAMETLFMLSKAGDFVPPISAITDQYGAGKISAQLNELTMQAIMAFPNTPEGKKARDFFIQSLRDNNKDIQKKGGKPILDDTWIDQFAGAHDAFTSTMDRKYGKGKWEVVGTTWDVKSQVEDYGGDYDNKGFSTDINIQVKANGKVNNLEVSCKKDWKIFLLNAGLGDAENWYYTLGPDREKRALELSEKIKQAKLTKTKVPKEEIDELKKLNVEALSKAPISNKKLQQNQMTSAIKGAGIIEHIETKDLDRIWKDWVSGNYEGGTDKKGNVKTQPDADYTKAAIDCHKKTSITNKEKFLACMQTKIKDFKTTDKYYKKAVVCIGLMLSDTNTDDDMKNWHKSHMAITKKFVTDAAEILAKDPEYRKMILRKLQEAIPMKSLTEGTEDMQIDGMYITQEHMFELFGTKDWNKIKEFLDVQVINGVGTLVYKAKSAKQEKPIPIALIGIREKGGGYDGNPALEVKPSKDFEELMGTISNKLNNTSSIDTLDKKTIKNPETGEDISIASALKYDKNSPVYKAAAKLVKNK